MYAVIQTGGKQIKVEKGSRIVVEKLPVEAGNEVVFDKVLMLSDGDKAKIGRPLVEGATVLANVLRQFRAPKIIVFKKRSKKGYQKRQGHRQFQTEIEIKEIKQV